MQTVGKSLGSSMASIGSRLTDLAYRGLGSRWFSTTSEAAPLTCELLGRATTSIHIVCTDADPHPLLTDCIVQSLHANAVKNPELDVALVCGPNPINSTLDALRHSNLADLPNVRVVGMNERPSLTWVVVDGAHVRIDHPRDGGKGSAHGRIAYDSAALAGTLEDKFRALLRRAARKDQSPQR